MTDESGTQVADHDAGAVVDSYERSVRNIVWYTIVGLVVYGFIAGLGSLSSWWFRFTAPADNAQASTGTRFTFTLDLGQGATVLGILTTLMIALHVVAWQIKPVGVLANLVHARRRLLGEIAGSLGFVAIITGAATILHGAPDETNIGQIAVGVAAIVVAVFAIDIRSVLESDRDLHRKVDDVSRQRDAVAAERVAARWATTRTATVTNTLWDFVAVSTLAAASLLILRIVTAESRTFADVVTGIGIAMAGGVLAALVAVYVVYYATLCFVTRNHFNFLLCVLAGAIWMLTGIVIAMTGWGSGAAVAAKVGFVIALACVILGPAGLVAAGLRTDAHRHLPGRTARAHLYAALERRRATLAGARNDAPRPGTTQGFLARQSHRYRVVTGTEPDPTDLT